MKQFLGIVPLQVGLCTLSATFIMLSISMISINMWSFAEANIKSILVFICIICLVIATWVIAYIGSFQGSLGLMTTALKLWKMFIFFWLILTIWSLFFTSRYEMKKGLAFTCLKYRCVPACFTTKYDINWDELFTHQILPLSNSIILSNTFSNTTSSPISDDVEFPVTTITLSITNSEMTYIKNNIKNEKLNDSGGIDTAMEWIVHTFNGTDAISTFEFLRDKKEEHNETLWKRNIHNLKMPVNKKMYEKYFTEPKKFIDVTVSGSTFELVLVPLMFYSLFVFAKSILYAYTLELKINMQLNNPDRCS